MYPLFIIDLYANGQTLPALLPKVPVPIVPYYPFLYAPSTNNCHNRPTTSVSLNVDTGRYSLLLPKLPVRLLTFFPTYLSLHCPKMHIVIISSRSFLFLFRWALGVIDICVRASKVIGSLRF